MADFETKKRIVKYRQAMADSEQRSYAHGVYGKVTANEHVALEYDFSKMTADEVTGYIKGSGG
jgi:hypothetical protein